MKGSALRLGWFAEFQEEAVAEDFDPRCSTPRTRSAAGSRRAEEPHPVPRPANTLRPPAWRRPLWGDAPPWRTSLRRRPGSSERRRSHPRRAGVVESEPLPCLEAVDKFFDVRIVHRLTILRCGLSS